MPDRKHAAAPRPELMSPAGGLDAAYAAFHYGADSVYLGLRKFSARADAENFSPEDLDAIVAFAHALQPRRKVYAAVNTLVLDEELPEIVALLGDLSDIGVDALIVQDLGLLRVARRHFPELRLHASTQMAVHNRAGVEALKELGFARATLARELTLDEVRDIAAVPGIEKECFVHGALCYSYSGLCLFSSLIAGRSGNRGRCAYMCRDEFTVQGSPFPVAGKAKAGGGFAFSMRDLALADQVPALIEAGVDSFKIEGRKKNPLYVGATTSFYRRLIDGKLSAADRAAAESDIRSIFSRPWTELYVRQRRGQAVVDTTTVGHRGSPIGEVAAVVPARERACLRFTTSRAIEHHDGLQVDVPGLPKPFGFAVEKLRILSRVQGKAPAVYEAPAGSVVEVLLPDDHPAIPRGAPVYCSSSQDAKRRYRFSRPKPGLYRIRRSMDLQLDLDASRLTVRARLAGNPPMEVEEHLAGAFAPAKDAGRMHAAMKGVFEKLGDTRFELGRFEFANPQGLFAPVSIVNPLRRKLMDKLEAVLLEAKTKRIASVQNAVIHSPKSAIGNRQSAISWSLKVDRISLLDVFEPSDWENIDEIVVEIAEDSLDVLNGRLRKLPRDRVRLALPIITRGWEEKGLRDKIDHLRRSGWTKWEAANLSAWPFLGLPTWNLEPGTWNLSADWSLYVTNRAAAEQALSMGASRFTLSPEDGLRNMRPLLREFGPKATVVVYQDTPLFISEVCVRESVAGGCANCDHGALEMVSSHGDKVLAVSRDCRTVVVGRRPLCLASRLGELAEAGAVSVRADFVYRPYTAAEVRNLWRALRSGSTPDGHTGNFDRGML